MPDIGMSADWIRDQFMKITALCERIITKQEEQDRRINKIEQKVDELHEKPAQRWETIVTAVLTGIIAILVASYFVIPKA